MIFPTYKDHVLTNMEEALAAYTRDKFESTVIQRGVEPAVKPNSVDMFVVGNKSAVGDKVVDKNRLAVSSTPVSHGDIKVAQPNKTSHSDGL